MIANSVTSENIVLVLEDSRTQARIVGALFERCGLKVEFAFTLDETFYALRRRSYYLILLDVFVNDENVLDHISALQKLAGGAPIAVMTAGQRGKPTAASHALNAARRACVDYLLPKPFDYKDIMQICGEIEDGRRHRKPMRRVLIIDDDAYTRAFVRDIIEEAGFYAAESASVEEAIMRLDITRIDAVVIDIVMPGIGGMTGIKIIKATWPQVPIIAMTGYVKDTDHLEKSLLNGAHHALPKPFGKLQLTGVLEGCLAAAEQTGAVEAITHDDVDDDPLYL
jgi:DNA-binding NtrC family response regulator